MIHLIDIHKIFRTGGVPVHALESLNLDIAPGEFVALMGPSGCGKTTLLNILGMIDKPTSGRYLFRGEDVTGYSENRCAALRQGKIGFVFQNFYLIDDMTVEENVMLPLMYLDWLPSERKQRALEVLEQFSMASRREFYPHQLSGGQQQRVAIARAVAARPELILADEPTGNLDSQQGQVVMSSLSALNKAGTTIVTATHNGRDAAYASRIVHLFDGRIVQDVPQKS